MSEELIIKHCSPTLAGIKTGNLFSCPAASRKEVTDVIKELNRKLVPKGLRVIPLRFSGNCALIYVFRPAKLASDLSASEARNLLIEAGYNNDNINRCVTELMLRLQNRTDFPHEIGLFLSYPPEDVRGFIENKANNFKCVGFWKVYGDAEKAQHTFCKYEKCADIYNRQWKEGKSIEQLTVAS